MEHHTLMKGVELLSERHIVGMMVMLAESDRRESEFLVICNSYYIIRDKIQALLDSGMIVLMDNERGRARWYSLTPKGRQVAELLRTACEAIDS